jgi:hypothetical protein
MLCLPCAASALEWDVRDVDHPRLGAIRVAVQRNPVVTSVAKEKIDSLVFLSCEKANRKIAIELANASEADARGGLQPKEMPQLICNTPLAQAGNAMRQSELATSWEISAIGDALVRGLSSTAMRQCASITVVQNVALPKGWSKESQRIEFELAPYSKELDAVFAACEETIAFAPSPSKPDAAKPDAAKPDASWKPARTTRKGKTNVRAGPSLDSDVVIELGPNTEVLVQRTSTEWWKVKQRAGKAFSGYIRQDRLTFQ